MSTDPITDPVQPDDGQGGGGQGGDPPYADYLNSIPEELRPQVEPAFQKWDGDVTRRFQDAAEYRKAWEPYEQFRDQLGDPEHVQELLQLRDVLVSNPQQAQQWWESYAQANGLTVEQAQQQAEQTPASEDFFLSEEDRLARLLDERLGPLQEKLSEYDSRWEQQEFEARRAEWNQVFEGQLDDLRTRHPDDFAIKDEKGGSLAEDYIARFAQNYIDSDPHHAVERGFQDWQQLRGQLERTVLSDKGGAPPPAESGGTSVSAPEDIPGLKEAGNVALERLKAANAS